jgi:hypothetical protein
MTLLMLPDTFTSHPSRALMACSSSNHYDDGTRSRPISMDHVTMRAHSRTYVIQLDFGLNDFPMLKYQPNATVWFVATAAAKLLHYS